MISLRYKSVLIGSVVDGDQLTLWRCVGKGSLCRLTRAFGNVLFQITFFVGLDTIASFVTENVIKYYYLRGLKFIIC